MFIIKIFKNILTIKIPCYTMLITHIVILCINIKGGIEMKVDRELLKGSTNLLVLSVLENENMYGYEMIKKIKTKSENLFEFQEGTLYPILHKLEEKGFISSYWDEVSGKKRKYYSITDEGKKQLKSKKEEWKEFSTRVNQVIGGVLFEY